MRHLFLLGLSTLLFTGVVIVPASYADEYSVSGVVRTQIEGVDNWGWMGGPQSNPTITCPGGEFMSPFDCSDSATGRLHLRDGAGWSCTTTNDPRMTGIGLYTSNANLDVDSNGPVWGEWKIVPMPHCNKDADFSAEYADLVKYATSFWHGTWNGQRTFDGDKNAWVGELKIVGKGFGGDLDGLHFKGMEWITTFTPFPIPYEYIFPYGSVPFDMPEAYLVGTITD